MHGHRIKIMKTRYSINVTQHHIDHGTQRHCRSCPIAMAIHEQTPFRFATIDEGQIFLYSSDFEDKRDGIPLPRRASDFVYDFDAGNKVKPFRFIIAIPR